MVAGVESAEVSGDRDPQGGPVPQGTVRVRLLGPMAISRAGAAVALPPSRKLRALIAYLALAPHPVMRAHLCELLWDIPNDPRGELRWCLSKARALLDDPGRRHFLEQHRHGQVDRRGRRLQTQLPREAIAARPVGIHHHAEESSQGRADAVIDDLHVLAPRNSCRRLPITRRRARAARRIDA